MPKVIDKRKVLGGRGSVVLYGSGTSSGQYFYRELIKGTKNYKTRRIDGVSSMDEAEAACLEIAFELNKEPDMSLVIPNQQPVDKPSTPKRDYRTGYVINRKRRSEAIETAFEKWLKIEQDKVDAGLLKQETKDNKQRRVMLHITPYLHSISVYQTSQIGLKTFDEYPIYRSDTTPLVRKAEIATFKEFCKNYLVKNKLLDSDLLMDSLFLPKTSIKQTDLMKNPAITPEDWKVIIDFVRDEWRHRPKAQPHNKSGWYFRNLFWHYLLFSKNTGMSPEEILKLKWKQIEIIDEGRLNSKGERVSWEVAYINTIRAKTQQAREIPANQARELKRWKLWLEEYIKEFNLLNVSITKDTFVFGDARRYWKPYAYKHIGETWREIRRELADKLTGHRFSPHPYTVYSLRSTFIEDQLIKGTPVMEVAEMAGHDVRETQKTYARLNLRRKGRELTLPKLGRKETIGTKVDLFTDETDEPTTNTGKADE